MNGSIGIETYIWDLTVFFFDGNEVREGRLLKTIY